MAERSLILDANILLRAVLGRRVGELIERYVTDVSLFAPDTAFLELEKYLPPLTAKVGMSVERTTLLYERLGRFVQELPQPVYGRYETRGASPNRPRRP